MSRYHLKGEEVVERLSRITSNQNEKNEDFIKNTVGDFGRWQLKISVLMALIKFPIAWFQMSIVFLAPPTKFWCKKTEEFGNVTETDWKRWIMSVNTTYLGSIKKGLNTGFCLMPLSEQSFLSEQNESFTSCTNGYSYQSDFDSSITSEWDLVCDREKLMDLSQITLMFGVLLGNIIFGVLADKKGRKKILIICLALQSILGIIASLSPYLWLFILLRCLLAIANGGSMVTSFVICMEVVGGKWRTIVPILYQIPFGLGYALMAGIAFFVRDWRYFHLSLSVLSSFYIGFIWLIPESPRWLLAVGKKQEAILILRKAAKENGKNLLNFDSCLAHLSNNVHKDADKQQYGGFRALFSNQRLARRSILVGVNWAISGITFYGFNQYMGNIGENLFVTVTLGGLISLPGTMLCVFLVANFGRRWTIASSYFLTAVCFLVILAFPKGQYILDWPRVLVAAIGIIGLSVSIPAMYLFTGELFPTVLRNSGLGFSMMFCRLASMLAPLILSLHNIASFLPLLVMGIASLIQVVLILPLPETKDSVLPDTIKDLNKRQRSSNNVREVMLSVKNLEVY